MGVLSEYLRSGGEFLVGEYGGRLVAMGALKPTGNGRAEVKRMRVHPDSQRRGFGRALLTALEQRAQELGFRCLHLETTVQQVGAQRLYQRSGFVRVGQRRVASFDCIVYEKCLPSE